MTRHLRSAAMLALTILLCGQIVFLTRQNGALRAQLADLATDVLSEKALAVGDYLDPIRLLDRGAGPALTDFVGQGSLVLFFSEDCPACQRALPIWDDLVGGVDAPRDIRILGIDIGGEGEDPGARAFPVFALDPRDRRTVSEQIPIVPTAVFVREDGTVDRVWSGVPRQDDVDMMSALLRSGRSG